MATLDLTPRPADLQHGTLKKILQRLNEEVVVDERSHEAVHLGHAWLVSDRQTLTAGNDYAYLITVPANVGVVPHMLFRINTSSSYYIEFFEAPTGVTGGAILPNHNRNRNRATTSQVVITGGVSAVGNGTRLQVEQIGGGVGGNAFGGVARADEEWLLQAGGTYLLVANCVSNGIFSVDFEWYEDFEGV